MRKAAEQDVWAYLFSTHLCSCLIRIQGFRPISRLQSAIRRSSSTGTSTLYFGTQAHGEFIPYHAVLLVTDHCEQVLVSIPAYEGIFFLTFSCSIYTKQTMSKDFAATNNNTFTHCNSTLKASAAASSSASASQTSLSPTSSSSGSPDTTASGSAAGGKSVAPIIGGAVGGALVAMALAALGVFFYRRSRRRRGPTPLDLSKEYTPSGGFVDDPSMGVVTPFSAASVQQSSTCNPFRRAAPC